MYQYSGASRRKGSRDDDGQNNPAEAARGSSRQITISARIQWKNLVKNKVSIIWRQGREDLRCTDTWIRIGYAIRGYARYVNFLKTRIWGYVYIYILIIKDMKK